MGLRFSEAMGIWTMFCNLFGPGQFHQPCTERLKLRVGD
jgi:hypothetical protein